MAHADHLGRSFGLTTVTLAWVATWLPVRPRVGWTAAGLLGAAGSDEVAWVTVQRARGSPPTSTTPPLDERLLIAGAVMVAVAIVVIAAMTLAAFARPRRRRRWRWPSGRGWWVAGRPGQRVWMLLHGLGLLEDDADPLVGSMSTGGRRGS